MAKEKETKPIWKDRTHHLWFPFSFTSYSIKNGRLYREKGFLSTTSDETLLYRIVDIKMKRTLAHRLFGTGDIILFTKADTEHEICLHNIKKPRQTKDMLSEMIEDARNQKNVVGKEFYSGPGMRPDGPGPGPMDMDPDHEGPDDFPGMDDHGGEE